MGASAAHGTADPACADGHLPPREPSDASLVLRFDDIAIETFAPSFSSERFDLYVTREPRDRGWESPGFRVEDEHGDWISFRCADFTVEEVRRP